MKRTLEERLEEARRIREKMERRTPEQIASDAEWSRQWLASLVVLPPIPQRPGEVQAIFIKRNAEEARQAAAMAARQAAHAAAVEAERQAEAKRVGAALADALVARGVTVAERCVRCGGIFIPEARGACSSCGAPPAGKP